MGEETQTVHAVDPDGVENKGLKKGSIGLVGATVIGLASTAPAYSLATTIALVAVAAGVHAPGFMIAAFIPMLFIAYAYRELNNVIPDCGTVFTWSTKAFGPHMGWMGGWGVAVTGTIFLGSAAQVTGQYLCQLFGKLDWATNQLIVAPIGIVFILGMAYIAYRGLDVAAWMQTVLVILQYVALALLAITLFWTVYKGSGNEDGTSLMPAWDWLNPFAGGITFADFTQAFLLCLFIYWGWDAVLAVNEETKDPEKTPGRAALLATVILLGGYVIVTMATVAYAGLGDTGVGLNNPDNVDNLLPVVALPVLGTWGQAFILLVVLLSAVASAQTTILPTARGTLSMAVYKALPAKFAQVHPKYMTPGFSTFVTCAVGLTYFVVMSAISDQILEDTISSISLAIAFYYALTGYSCAWYFRKEWFVNFRSFMFILLLPVIGAAILTFAFFASAVQMWAPDYSGVTYFGVGSVFVIGIGSLLIGVVLMLIWQLKQPAFFRGETLKHDTPVLAPDV